MQQFFHPAIFEDRIAPKADEILKCDGPPGLCVCRNCKRNTTRKVSKDFILTPLDVKPSERKSLSFTYTFGWSLIIYIGMNVAEKRETHND